KATPSLDVHTSQHTSLENARAASVTLADTSKLPAGPATSSISDSLGLSNGLLTSGSGTSDMTKMTRLYTFRLAIGDPANVYEDREVSTNSFFGRQSSWTTAVYELAVADDRDFGAQDSNIYSRTSFDGEAAAGALDTDDLAPLTSSSTSTAPPPLPTETLSDRLSPDCLGDINTNSPDRTSVAMEFSEASDLRERERSGSETVAYAQGHQKYCLDEDDGGAADVESACYFACQSWHAFN
ncbi:unnamed protein product, partial [Protopolystoma xenopodis]